MSGTGADRQLAPAIEYHVVNSLGWNQLRPLQHRAVAPLAGGMDSVLVAPTAGGKTEAALFPLLTRMADEGWTGTSLLYLTPLKALLNNLLPRLQGYTAWLGRTAAVWHGDVADSARRRVLVERPDVLLTTPESLESMLVSRRVDHRRAFADVRAVVVDELHAFAGADRGWHMLAVLERVSRLAGRAVQRVGLSATVGNPTEMLAWLQGSNRGRPSQVVEVLPDEEAAQPDIVLDHVGSVENAATVVAQLHRGEKRLAFTESRRQAEELAFELRERGVTTYVSHSSLSADERRTSERAFAEGTDCVVVATSTLELGIDIGDLDRVVQVDAPRTVASLLQRLGRTGRRAGTVRNLLVLATEDDAFLRAAGLLHLRAQGYVEPVVPPPSPHHLAAQQLLALTLQEGRISPTRWRDWWGELGVMQAGDDVLTFLCESGFLQQDSGLLHLGERAEKEFGRRYFMDLLASFTAAFELAVTDGRREIGSLSPLSVRGLRPGQPLVVLLGGRGWRVEHVDWERHTVTVREERDKGKVRWQSTPTPESFALCQAQREILLGTDPDVTLSRRARDRLGIVRQRLATTVDGGGLVLEERRDTQRLWTWAGAHANVTLLAALGIDDGASTRNAYVDLPHHVGPAAIRAAAEASTALPLVTPEMVDGLKFSAALPARTARDVVARRLVDIPGMVATATAPLVRRRLQGGADDSVTG
ncbi:DEAD/DEAH box helicase [Cellulomonas endophytica]|uniref:DEAD/DEAH box helicase n=1 Tax=Cellulomonas endophytica TaxID=2494735 RepID=UPI00196B3C8F|nr:DEAD/DEAH box helicase [Cellulomonas endophytica]